MENFLLLPRAVVASLFDIGMAGLIGVSLARLWLNCGVEGESIILALRRAFLVCAALMVSTLPLQLWLLTATMVGSSSAGEVARQLMDVLMQTHAGRVLIPDFALSFLLLLVSAIPSLARRRSGIFLGIAQAVTLLVFRSASGHAAADGDFTVSELVQFLHLASICAWAGGVMIAGAIVLPRLISLNRVDEITDFGRRLSRTSSVAVLFVSLSGVYNAWRGLGSSLHPLFHSQWGSLLVLKSGLVGTALALGASNWLILRGEGRLSTRDATRFASRVRVEAAVLLAVLLVSGWLAGSPPATGS
jgi:putative copper resistance protein D